MEQLVKGHRFVFSSSEDNAVMKRIQETHAPDGHDINIKPLLQIAENIFCCATAGPANQTQEEAQTDKNYQAIVIAMLEALAHVINRVSTEIAWKCSSGGDAHETTVSILIMLSNYSWDAKLAITLAAFAINYGEFWLVAQNYTSNQLARSVAILRQLSEIFEHPSILKPQFDAIRNFINTILGIAKCIVEIGALPSQSITTDIPALSTAVANIPISVYWSTRSIVACAFQIKVLIGQGRVRMVPTTEAEELLSLAHKLSNIHSQLMVYLTECYKYVDEKRVFESYQNLLQLLGMTHIDNMRVLKALICAKDDLQPLVDGTTMKRVNIDVVLRKNVLLLISDLGITQEELRILEKIYNDFWQHQSRQESQYEVVWLPIPDPAIPWTASRQKQFQNLQSSMTWYTVYHPSLIDRTVIKFIKEVWHFEKKHICVVLDPEGRAVCPNAFPMMCIWGSAAFPFTTSREEALWKNETWSLELLVDRIDPVILKWISEGRYICLYGGDDMEWIRKFTRRARAVAQAASIPLGIVYVGKSNPKERVRRTISNIIAEDLSHYWQDVTSVWYFWVRIESMWHSKNQLGRTFDDDPILPGLMTMLAFDSSEGGWALLSKGSEDMAKAKGTAFLTCLLDYNIWKEHVQEKGFLLALKDYLKELQTQHHCNRLKLSVTSGVIPEKVICPECGRTMDRFVVNECFDE